MLWLSFGIDRIYIVFALITCLPMLMIWFNNPHDLNHFTPAYAFLVSPDCTVATLQIVDTGTYLLDFPYGKPDELSVPSNQN
jgi:hypothetical protein